MPKELEDCVKKVKKRMREGKIPKFYLKDGKTISSSPFAICKSTLKL